MKIFIIALEADDGYPSLGPLIKIARALGVRLGAFMDDHAGEDPCVTRANELTEELAMRSDADSSAHMRYHSLGMRRLSPTFSSPRGCAIAHVHDHEAAVTI